MLLLARARTSPADRLSGLAARAQADVENVRAARLDREYASQDLQNLIDLEIGASASIRMERTTTP
jgi:hypothetical protein